MNGEWIGKSARETCSLSYQYDGQCSAMILQYALSTDFMLSFHSDRIELLTNAINEYQWPFLDLFQVVRIRAAQHQTMLHSTQSSHCPSCQEDRIRYRSYCQQFLSQHLCNEVNNIAILLACHFTSIAPTFRHRLGPRPCERESESHHKSPVAESRESSVVDQNPGALQ